MVTYIDVTGTFLSIINQYVYYVQMSIIVADVYGMSIWAILFTFSISLGDFCLFPISDDSWEEAWKATPAK